jgi:serine/threonine protein phosphatase 1
MTTYAIGDIHGQLDLLRAAHARIASDRAREGEREAPVVHLGDLVDRGPDSRGVIAFLMDGLAQGENWVVLKGNHDRMFTRFLADPSAEEPGLRPGLSWLHPRLGGADTLASYGVRSAADRPVAPVHAEARGLVPQAHAAWLDALPLLFQREEAVFVHAGIRPGVAFDAQDETDLVWIRGGFLDDPRDHGALIVHGHTALEAPEHYGNRLNLDSGAAYGGPLTAVAIEGRRAWLLTDTGREELRPAPAAGRPGGWRLWGR